jgi:hypothetical protein
VCKAGGFRICSAIITGNAAFAAGFARQNLPSGQCCTCASQLRNAAVISQIGQQIALFSG